MKKATRFFFTACLFFIITMPFRKLFGLTGLTEVRPAGALPPAFGLLFGTPGALGCAVGNLAADIISGYPLKVCGYGFAAQFLYGWLPCLMWYGIGKHKDLDIRLNSVRHIIKYIGIIFTDALFMAVALGVMLEGLGLGRFLSQDTLLLFLNNLMFSMVLGIPILILGNMAGKQGKKQALTLNVRFVLIFLVLSVISALFMGISSYWEMYHYVKDAVQLWNRVCIRVSADFFLLCGLSIVFLWYLERNITVPIEKLAGIARDYADMEKPEQIKTEAMEKCGRLGGLPGETGYLASAFLKMMQDVEHYIDDITLITAEKERIRTELMVASRMQTDMLPDAGKVLADRRDFDLCARMRPAKEVGGDFYDFFLLDEDRLAFLVADVSGKGVPAALFMVVAKTLLKNRTGNTASAAEAFTDANEGLCRDNKNNMFVTAWMGILTISTGRLVYVNAGHTRPLLKKKDGSYVYLKEQGGFVLAGMEDTQYTQRELYLSPGDMLFLYTDGVTEANDEEGRLYGEERLLCALNKNPELAPGKVLSAIQSDIEAFQGNAEQFDDITMLSFRYSGNGYRTKTGVPDMTYIWGFNNFVEEILEEASFSRKSSAKLRMAMDEIFSNICYYSGAKEVTVGCRVVNGEASLYFEDDGIPYDPLQRPDPDVSELLEDRKEGGLGIYLVKKRMDDVRYEYVNGKNRLTILKR